MEAAIAARALRLVSCILPMFYHLATVAAVPSSNARWMERCAFGWIAPQPRDRFNNCMSREKAGDDPTLPWHGLAAM